jgi:hypothetical protein
MKDLKDMEEVTEVEVDIEVEKLVEEDQFVVIIVMRKGILQETSHFHEDPGAHIVETILIPLKNP